MRIVGLSDWCKESGILLSTLAAMSRVHYATARNIARAEGDAPIGAAVFKVLRAAERLGAEVEITVKPNHQGRRLAATERAAIEFAELATAGDD